MLSCDCLYDYVKIDPQLFDILMFQISFRSVYTYKAMALSTNVAFLNRLLKMPFYYVVNNRRRRLVMLLQSEANKQ